MAISERDLHPYIKTLVEEYGALSVTELDGYLRDVLELDGNDLTILMGRNDDKFSQKVRNLVSHSQGTVSNVNGYIIDKTTRPATFYAHTKTGEKLSSNEVIKRKNKKETFKAKKINFEEINKEKSYLGLSGEKFALRYEQERLKELGVSFNIMNEVIHVSHKYGDGAGYDIFSRKDDDFMPRYIEVKTTTTACNTPFYMSKNEKRFMEIYKEEAVIYRVFNFNDSCNTGEIKIICYDELINDYRFDPITYKVILK